MRKICVVTSSRADFGLLTPLLHEINKDSELQLQLIVTGMHLSEEYGLTLKEIEKEFTITKSINILKFNNNAIGISQTMGLTQSLFAEAFEELHPDILVVLGDRFEILSVVTSAMISKIPTAHISGGELTLGAIDESIRHSITKMSQIHFVATKEYKKRVCQLGENPEHVYNFGEAGLDNITQIDLLSKKEFEESINFTLDNKSLLITYHPETLVNKEENKLVFENLLMVVDKLQNTTLIFTKANNDEGGEVINHLCKEFVDKNPHKAKLFDALGQLRYLSALQYIDAVVGNTSSGIVEAPSFKTATINIGNRQQGRTQAISTINCQGSIDSIQKAFEKLYTEEFQTKLLSTTNPYFKKDSSFNTKEVLKNIDLTNIVKKNFYDVEFVL